MPTDFRVGDWVVRSAEDRLLRNGETRHVRSKVMDLLVFLATHAGEVLSKEKLLDAVWKAEFVSESALTSAVTELRQVLDDDADKPKILETIPKRGYRLIAPVDWMPPARSDGAAAPSRPHGRTPPSISWWLLGATIAAGLLLVGSRMFVQWSTVSPSSAVTRFTIPIAPAENVGYAGPDRLNDGRPSSAAIAMSPDGRNVVFVGLRDSRRDLYVRPLDQLDARVIPGTEGAQWPFFSPDGEWIGFWRQTTGELQKIPLKGGPPVTICSVRRLMGAAWDDDDRIVFGETSGGLYQVAASGGTPELLTRLDPGKGEVSHRLPHILPDSNDVLFTITYNRFPKWADTHIAAYSRSARTRSVIHKGGADARYVRSGHLVYVREGAVLAVPFDLARRQVTGGPVGVLSDVMQAVYGLTSTTDTGVGQLSISNDGTLAYVPVAGGVARDDLRSLFWVDRAGRAQKLPLPPRPFVHPRISPDGTRIAVATAQSEQDIWVYDLTRETMTRLTTEGRNGSPVWSPDGSTIAYRSSVAGPDNLFLRRSDGGGAVQRLSTRDEHEVPGAWSPDGRVLLFYSPEGPSIWTLSMTSARTPRRLITESTRQGGADFSPDGKWLAYATMDTGRWEVYVQSFPSGSWKRQVSTGGGMSPVWRGDGRELFYVIEPLDPLTSVSLRIMSVPVVAEDTDLRLGPPRLLFEGPYEWNFPARQYDVARDGEHFVLIERTQIPPVQTTHIVIVQNWLQELAAKVPVR